MQINFTIFIFQIENFTQRNVLIANFRETFFFFKVKKIISFENGS